MEQCANVRQYAFKLMTFVYDEFFFCFLFVVLFLEFFFCGFLVFYIKHCMHV
jgi:hypothetical protein